MHVAICDDNVADRKQTERLLHRESDRRLASHGNFYIDSYGTAESMLANPMKYEVYFIDICLGTLTAMDILAALSKQGIRTLVVFCCSKTNYRLLPIPKEEQTRVMFLDKPLKADELSSILDTAQKLADEAIPFIELRTEAQTQYVKEEDILYVIQKGGLAVIHLISGQEISLHGSAMNIFSEWECVHKTFFMASSKTIINGRHIEKTGFHKIIMKDGHSFSVSGADLKNAKYIMQNL